MLITTEIQNLLPGDVLHAEAYEDGSPKEEYEETFSIIREALNPPTTKHLSLINARTVLKVPTVARKYVRVVMGTYAVVRRLKGTPVVVDRPDANGPQNGSESVLAVLEHWLSGRWSDAHRCVTWCTCGLSFYGENRELADEQWKRHAIPLGSLPAPTEEIPLEGPNPIRAHAEFTAQRKPFNYATAEFSKLGDYRTTDYRTKLKVHNENGETRWMDIHPDDLAALQRLMEDREFRNDEW